MRILTKLNRYDGFEQDWKRLIILSISIMLIGTSLTIASIIKPDIVVSSARGFSWLPISGIIILALGILECLDALLAKEQRDILQNLQVGVLDGVIGLFIIGSVSGHPERLSILIGAFLMVRGIIRVTLTYAMRLPNAFSTSLGGLVSIILGICAWQEWPTNAGWFLAFCLNMEITARGWAMTSFALWVRKQSISSKS
ncbi:MAG: hypothetical protein methR_P0917 [Methyloprofundus sp.]|nr:MAG: hypothetical protein methR_P0917 [Methyloprofundus sp.]